MVLVFTNIFFCVLACDQFSTCPSKDRNQQLVKTGIDKQKRYPTVIVIVTLLIQGCWINVTLPSSTCRDRVYLHGVT